MNCIYLFNKKLNVFVCKTCGRYSLIDKVNNCKSVIKRTKVFNTHEQCENLKEVGQQIKVTCGPNKTSITDSYSCEIYNRCLPYYNPINNQLIKWLERPESKLYHLCAGCTKFKPKEN